ncbi:fatty acid desaturase family protein [Aquabacterium sp.]|uniref:fatty acid desaturase family protein n=1 Tax=Aquabacterium sp. TaxID=1872578 RepID=UPI0040384DEA
MAPASHAMLPAPRMGDADVNADMRLAAFAAELDALKAETMAQVGERDARYVVALLWAIRGLETLGRILLLGAPWWPTWWLGAAILSVSKVLQSGEFAHNVMHGQYDWMNDPRFEGKTHDWDLACTKEDWRHSHNFLHHHYTNVIGLDRDFGYGAIRLSADVPWEPRHLIQLPYALIGAFVFEWAIGVYNMELERLLIERDAATRAQVKARIKALWPNYRAKIWRQVKKDYLLWPVVGGLVSWALGAGFAQGWLAILLGHAMANVMRNIWNFIVIFCGHFPDGVATFEREDIAGETRGHWYLRQVMGSVNIRGGFVMQMLTGHLSHQIEHHLFPDMPSRRYVDIAPRVRDICQRYGVRYNEGGLLSLWPCVAWRIVRYTFPGGQRLRQAVALPTR